MGGVLTGRAAAEVAACHHNAALREVGGDVLVHAAQAVAADLLRVGQGQIAAGVDLVGVDVVAHDDDLSSDLTVHKNVPPFSNLTENLWGR